MTKLLCSAAVAAFAIASPAAAATYVFTLTSPASNALFTIDSSTTPSNSNAAKGFTEFGSVAGTYNGVAGFADVYLYTDSAVENADGLALTVPGGDAFFARAGQAGKPTFSGSVGAPTFLVGTYTLPGANGATKAATLTISTAPEPATWAMMVGGFGLIGVAMRRRKLTVRFA